MPRQQPVIDLKNMVDYNYNESKSQYHIENHDSIENHDNIEKDCVESVEVVEHSLMMNNDSDNVSRLVIIFLCHI